MLANVPAWAKSSKAQADDFYMIDKLIKKAIASDQPLRGKAMLILTGKGWVHESLFRKQ